EEGRNQESVQLWQGTRTPFAVGEDHVAELAEILVSKRVWILPVIQKDQAQIRRLRVYFEQQALDVPRNPAFAPELADPHADKERLPCWLLRTVARLSETRGWVWYFSDHSTRPPTGWPSASERSWR